MDTAIGMRKHLRLVGNRLIDEDGLVIAELVEAETGGMYWQMFGGNEDMFVEICIVGQGRHVS